MLRVTIELLPEGDATLARTLAVMTVANDDTGTPMNGHYDVNLTYIEPDGSTFTKTARVADFDRDRPAVDLVAAALSVVNPLKRGMASFDDRLAQYDPTAPYAGEVWAKTQPVGQESGAPQDDAATPLEQLRGMVQRYDNPTDPVWPINDETGTP